MTSAAMKKLRSHGCTVDHILKTSDKKLGELIYPVSFYKVDLTSQFCMNSVELTSNCRMCNNNNVFISDKQSVCLYNRLFLCAFNCAYIHVRVF